MTLRVLMLYVCAALVCCATAGKSERRLEPVRQEALATIDIDECKNRGGTVQAVCLLGTPACVVPYSDAGDLCTSSSECEGRCLQADAAEVSEAAFGVCESSNDPCGCFAELTDGVVGETLCVD